VRWRAWWKQNRTWLALLIPLLALALGASAFRLTRLYLPWEYHRPQVSATNTMRFTQSFSKGNSTTFTRTVDITVTAVEAVSDYDGHIPIEGGTMYRIDLAFAAAPDQMLKGCTVALIGPDGTQYGTQAAQNTDLRARQTFASPDCVPNDAPGPDWDGLSDTLVPATVERPAQWSRSIAVTLPPSVPPTQVRISWDAPEYALLQVPN